MPKRIVLDREYIARVKKDNAPLMAAVATMEQKKMIACQLIKEVKVARGYELEIIFDLNYEQFLSL